MSITYRVESGCAELVISRPERRNALTQEMYAALAAGLTAAQQDESIHALLITGEGGQFTAGNDLAEFLGEPSTDPDRPVVRFMRALAGFDKPVLAAVEGHAVGIGTTLLLHADFVYLAENARLSMPFVALGLVPEFAASFLVPRRVGHLRAAELLMLAEPLAASRALEWGLANAVVPPGQALAVARATAARLAALPLGGLRETKRLMKQAQAGMVAEVIQTELEVFGARLGGPEVREAVAAFREKRAPDFRGKGR
ncbi:MAG: enoyl-CoA hydratase-related protein [Steroidobacteraceae bacterium]